MGRRFPPQLRASLLRPLLQQRHLLGSPAAASPHPLPMCFASAASAGAAVETRSSSVTDAWHPSALAFGPFFPFCIVRWKNKQCYNLSPASAYSSSSTSGSPGVVVVESPEDFENALKKVEEGALPAIFYFSATWCGPCKFLAPVVNELSKTYPNCVTYKIDIDMEGIQNKLSELGISAVPNADMKIVMAAFIFHSGKPLAMILSGGESIIYLQPTLNFYKDGKMAAKVVGADVQKIKGIMDEFYK